MKPLILLCALIFAGLYSCDYDDGIGDYKEDIIGGPILGLFVSPTSGTLYVDSDLPTMSYGFAPLGASDTTVTWVSDKPEILSVDSAGVLAWGTIVNSEVKITAISNSNPEITSSCTFTIRNARGKYGFVDLRRACGLWMIDRNLGATAIPTTWVLTAEPESRGDYYQWGKNEPVANPAIGGEDGKGGKWYYDNGRGVNGGYPNFDFTNWTASSTGFLDWSVVENHPGDWEGWRLPTKEELEKLMYYMDPNNFRTAADIGAAEELREKLNWRSTGTLCYYDYGKDFTWLSDYMGIAGSYTGSIWSSTLSEDGTKAWLLEITQEGAQLTLEPLYAAAPIRLVCEAQNFDDSWVESGDDAEEGGEGENGN